MGLHRTGPSGRPGCNSDGRAVLGPRSKYPATASMKDQLNMGKNEKAIIFVTHDGEDALERLFMHKPLKELHETVISSSKPRTVNADPALDQVRQSLI